jgi:hypothetical protein
LDLASAKLEDKSLQDKTSAGDSTGATSFHIPSTDLTELEQSLDYWRQQHFQHNYSCMTREDEPHSKVRYNDTGSLEEVGSTYKIWRRNEFHHKRKHCMLTFL